MNETIIIDKYHSIVDDICIKNKYDGNIKHLLYIILPVFIMKYGIKNEEIVLDCFSNTYIYIDKKNKMGIEAFFDRRLFFSVDNYRTQKYIVINGFEKDSYIYLIDSIVHEFNHAINSINNEIIVKGDEIKLRAGLSFVIYKNEKYLKKENTYVLEEMINTKQSEEIISLIYDLEYDGVEEEIKRMLDIIKKEKSSIKYSSDAYEFHMKTFSKLLDNKTFLKNVELYRLNGNIDEIKTMFNDTCGENLYDKLNDLLSEVTELIYKYEKAVIKFNIRSKIVNLIRKINQIIDLFDNSCIYK